jgi:hypothetical protein
MGALVNLFLDICLFRKGPQDLPASVALLKLSLFLYGLSGLILLMIDVDQLNILIAVLLTLFDIILLAMLSYAVLYVLGYLPRFTQTLTALTGVGVLLQIAAMPLAIWTRQELAARGSPEFPVIMRFVLLGWAVAVMAHVLKHAFSTSRVIGVLYAVAYIAISWTLFDWILPPPVTVN